MAIDAGTLRAAVQWDLSDFDRGTRHIEGAFGHLRDLTRGLAESFQRIGRNMTLGITLPAGAFAGVAVRMASNAQELQSAFDHTFGRMAVAMNRWAESTGDAMGRSTQEMQEGALALGELFKAAAPTEQAAARMSQRFTELAQDFASFRNLEFDDALARIMSGLAGETEPLRRFGVFLSEAAVQAKALEMGLVDANGELSEQAKIMARAELIAEGLASAQGDVARTSNSFANRVRALKAELAELAVDVGERLLPMAERLVGWARSAVHWVSELPEPVKRLAAGFVILAAATGPLTIALSALAITVLPLFISTARPVLFLVSALVNPIGTAVITLSRFAFSWEAIGAVLTRVRPLLSGVVGSFTRVLGPIGLVVSAFLLFRDNVVRALQTIWDRAREILGPALSDLFRNIEGLGRDLVRVFDTIANSEVGQAIGELIDLFGELLEVLLELAGSALVHGLRAVISLIDNVVTAVRDMVQIVGHLLRGEWSAAWAAAGGEAESAENRIVSSALRSAGAVGVLIDAMGILRRDSGRVAENMLGSIAGGVQGWISNARLNAPQLPETEGGVRSPRASRTARGARGGGSTGPSAAELAERREALELEQQIAIAREAGDLDKLRALERQRELVQLIGRYEQAGLDRGLAEAAALRDMTELEAARAAARRESREQAELDFDIQLARIRGDERHAAILEDQQWLTERIAYWQREEYDLIEATTRAKQDQLAVDRARAEAAEARMTAAREAHQLELMRIRGDHPDAIRLREEEFRIADRIRELQRDDPKMNDAEAEAIALREGADRARAHLQGTFRDTFRDGLYAALNGRLGDFFENWMRERMFDALSRVLDRLADQLADLVASSRSGGGLFGAIAGFLGAAGGGGGSKFARMGSGLQSVGAAIGGLPRFAQGGMGVIKGITGVDRNLISINGRDAFYASHGEMFQMIPQGQGGSANGRVRIELDPGLRASILEESAANSVEIVRANRPGMVDEAALSAVSQLRRRRI